MTDPELLASYLDALRPIIYISNFDFAAADSLIRAAVPDEAVEEYNNAQGAVHFDTKVPRSDASSLFESDESGESHVARLGKFLDRFITDAAMRRVLVLKDVHEEIGDPGIVAQLKAIALRTMQEEGYWVPVVIVSTRLQIPVELEKLITVFEIAYPTKGEIARMLDLYAESYQFKLGAEDRDELALAFKGLSEFEIRQILNLAYQQSGKVSRSDMGLILKEKERSIRKSGLLEAVHLSNSEMDIGGLSNLVGYLEQKAEIYRNLAESIKFGVDIPKGILIVGMPGCGKSLTAKACAQLFHAPLLRLDVGRLLGKYVGESEDNLRRAIQLAEAATPCVLWIDEIEKAFAGVGKDSSGGGVTTRLFGYFLTWMQEKDSTVYVVATANDITGIPPEFLRRGRFDEIFSVRLPDEEERRRIFEIHLRKRNKDWKELGLRLNELVKKTSGGSDASFSGADIESIVKTGIEAAFTRRQQMRQEGKPDWEKEDLTQEDLEKAIENTTPIRQTLSDKIEALEKSLKKFQITPASKGNWAKVPKFVPARASAQRKASSEVSQTTAVSSGKSSVSATEAGLISSSLIFTVSGSHPKSGSVFARECRFCSYWKGRKNVCNDQNGHIDIDQMQFDPCSVCGKSEGWRALDDTCINFIPMKGLE